MNMERYVVKIEDEGRLESTSFSVMTVGGKNAAIRMVWDYASRNQIANHSDGYFATAELSHSETDYDLPDEAQVKTPDWVNNLPQ